MSIRARVTLFGVGVVAVIYTVVAVLVYLLLSAGFAADQDRLLAARSSAALASLRSAPVSALSAGPGVVLGSADAVATGEAVVVVLDSSGTVVSSTGHFGDGAVDVPSWVLAAASRDGRVVATVPVSGVATRVLAVPWSRAHLSGYVVAAQTIRAMEAQRHGMIVVLAAVGVVGLVAGFAATWFAAGRALRPLRELAVLADSVGGSADLTVRLPAVRQRDDLGRLTVSFNTMMGRLEAAYRRVESALAAQRRFAADASHELRTPLTTIRGNVGFLRAHPAASADDRAAALADLESESARMARLVDDLLLLARSDGGGLVPLSSVDLLEVSESVCRQAEVPPPESSGGPAVVRGDGSALRRMVWNLVSNAVAHGEPPVSVSVSSTSGTVVLRVSDGGAGVPAGLESAVFERFFQVDPARSGGGGGAGLGLAIARSVAEAHGGTITVSGAVFTVSLPASSVS